MEEENRVIEATVEFDVDKKECQITDEQKITYTDNQHNILLKHIGAEDKNFFLIMFFTLSLGGMLFWQILQFLNIVEVSPSMRNLEEPMIILLMVGLVLGYFYQKNNISKSEFIDIINKNYYIHRVMLKNKNLNFDKNSFECEIFVEGYDKLNVEKNVYDALTPNSYVDIVYSGEKHEILCVVPEIKE